MFFKVPSDVLPSLYERPQITNTLITLWHFQALLLKGISVKTSLFIPQLCFGAVMASLSPAFGNLDLWEWPFVRGTQPLGTDSNVPYYLQNSVSFSSSIKERHYESWHCGMQCGKALHVLSWSEKPCKRAMWWVKVHSSGCQCFTQACSYI